MPGSRQRTLSDRLSPSLRLELDAIQDVYRLAQTETFARISQQLAEAEAVFILGIQSTRGIANAFFSHLEYLRPRVSYVDGLSGTWVESLNSEYQRPYVVVTDTRAYSTVARQYCRAASDRKIPLALITDLWCPWARDYPMDLLQVKTDTGHFWDSLAPITCLFNLLLSAVVEQLGDKLSARLARSVAVAEQSGYRLQLYDAYRPHAAQIRLWDACPDPRFVASLAVGSHHSHGVAVDVTLLDEQGKALDMGTGFDEMNEKSYAWCAALPVAVQRNRLQLYAVMAAGGFVGIETEWWHFELPDADRYPLLPDRFGCTLPHCRTAV